MVNLNPLGAFDYFYPFAFDKDAFGSAPASQVFNGPKIHQHRFVGPPGLTPCLN